MKSKTVICVTLFVFWFVVLYGQQMPSINYTTHNGLPQIQVQKLLQDSKGYIWVATKGGLAQFNGENFNNYLVNHYIESICETQSGVVLISTNRGVYRFEQNKIVPIIETDKPTDVLALDTDYIIYNNDSITLYRNHKPLKTYNVSGIVVSHFIKHSAYDTKKHTAYFIDNTNKKYYTISNDSLHTHQLKEISFPYTFNNGSVYFLTIKKDNKHIAVNPTNTKTYFSFNFDIASATISDFTIKAIPGSEYLFGYYHNYFYLNNTTLTVEKLNFPVVKLSYAAILDKDNNYWVGTDNGLYQISNGALTVFSKDFLNDFWTIIKGKDNCFYGGSLHNGLYKIDFNKKTKTPIKVKNILNVYEKGYYYGASMGQAGNLYFPTQNGVVKYNYKKSVFLDNDLSTITKYDSISKKIYASKWHGFTTYDNKGNQTVFKDSTKTFIPSLPTDFEFTKNNLIWIGSWSKLSFYDKKTNEFKSCIAVLGEKSPKTAISLDKDKKGNIWIGSRSGLWFYNTSKNICENIKPSIYNTYILDVKSVDNDFLLIGTSREVYVVNLKKFYENGVWESKIYNFRNGFIGQEIAQNGFFIDNRKVYIPTTTNVCVLNLDEISFKPDYFNVFCTTINSSSLTNKQQNGETIFNVPKGDNEVTINYESVGFGMPTTTKYRYKLDGVDKDWSSWTENQQASYNNLSSKTYQFKVQALNGSYPGMPLTKETTIKFRVALPFYLEPNFYKYAFFATILLVLIATYSVWKSYQHRIKVQEKEKQIKLLEIATLQAQINPHFIFNFLSSIQGLISKNSPEKANNYLVKFSRLMRNYMESSIKSTNILTGKSFGNENTIKEEIDLIKTYLDLEKMKYQEGKISYQINVDDSKLLHKTIPPMIIQPFVENAIKHGILPKEGNGNINLSFSSEQNGLVCTVSDDGIGRALSQTMKKDSIEIKKSRGLELIKKRVEMLNQLDYNIDISFIDPQKGGTIVNIKIQYKL